MKYSELKEIAKNNGIKFVGVSTIVLEKTLQEKGLIQETNEPEVVSPEKDAKSLNNEIQTTGNPVKKQENNNINTDKDSKVPQLVSSNKFDVVFVKKIYSDAVNSTKMDLNTGLRVYLDEEIDKAISKKSLFVHLNKKEIREKFANEYAKFDRNKFGEVVELGISEYGCLTDDYEKYILFIYQSPYIVSLISGLSFLPRKEDNSFFDRETKKDKDLTLLIDYVKKHINNKDLSGQLLHPYCLSMMKKFEEIDSVFDAIIGVINKHIFELAKNTKSCGTLEYPELFNWKKYSLIEWVYIDLRARQYLSSKGFVVQNQNREKFNLALKW